MSPATGERTETAVGRAESVSGGESVSRDDGDGGGKKSVSCEMTGRSGRTLDMRNESKTGGEPPKGSGFPPFFVVLWMFCVEEVSEKVGRSDKRTYICQWLYS